jgi:hypothetical protein
MTPADLAARLQGRAYGSEMTLAEEADAKAAGLVVVFGYSDDNAELRGAIYDEVAAWRGTTFRVNADGLVPTWPHDGYLDESEAAAYFDKLRAGFKTIEALWDVGGGEPLWTYKTDIPHSAFIVTDEGEPFCRGIVFRLEDARP